MVHGVRRSVGAAAFGALVGAVFAASATAQATRGTAPQAGTWGGEVEMTSGSSQSASLLRFMSPQTALVGSLGYSRLSSDATGGGSGSNVYSQLSLQVGVRRYTRSGLGVRPLYGGGLVVNRTTTDLLNTSNTTTGIGGYGEAGATYFFTPHVSLGVTGGLNVLSRDDSWSVGFTLARLTAGVYF